ncbi:MAG TPA: glycosyltransferase family 4 protein [Gemmatimonadota bacterium]|jgi:glycosyltransferase involved in cell wall biosynthesis
MQALHVFPIFGSDLPGGSQVYEFHLSRALVRRGVGVRALATRSRGFHPVSAFTLDWPDEVGDAGARTTEDGVEVLRFPGPPRIPAFAGHAASARVLRRWEREDRAARMLEGSIRLPDHRILTALERPRRYDVIVDRGRGPLSRPLLRAVERELDGAGVVLTGFVPFGLVPRVVELCRRRGKPVVVLALFHPHDPYHYFASTLEALRRADAVLLQTDYAGALLERRLPGLRGVVVGAGVEPDEIAAAEVDGRRFRQRHGLGDAPLLLHVGRKEPGKRWGEAVEAIRRVRSAGARLALVGRDVDREPVAADRALVLGERPRAEVLDAYDACDALVLPSHHESFGIVLLEAWMRGKPVLASRGCGPVASIVEDGADGFLCDGPSDYASAFDRLIADPALARRMGERGRAKVLARYTWDGIAGRVHALYEELAGRAAAVPAAG